MDQPIRVLIVDDHPAMRSGLIALFQREADFFVVGEAANGNEAVDKALLSLPDVILMDLALPQKSGLEAIREILAVNSATKILIFTSYSEGDHILAAIKAGAIGYLMKDSFPQEIFNAVRNAYAGRPAFTSQIEINLLQHIKREPVEINLAAALTHREVEILRLMANGNTNLEIASNLTISEGTVRSHISHLIRKLGLNNRAQAIIFAVRNGLVDLE